MPAELRTIEAEGIGEGIIERIEWALEQAKEGKLSSVAIAVVYRDGAPDWRWSHAPNMSLLLGVLVRLQAAIIHELSTD